MPEFITPDIQQFYDDGEIWPIIQGDDYLSQVFEDPMVKNNVVCIVLPIVHRRPGYVHSQFDLEVLIKHAVATELGQLEMYRVYDFIRNKVDVGPVIETIFEVTEANPHQVLESIKRQIKFLQNPENQDLPLAPAQIVNQ